MSYLENIGLEDEIKIMEMMEFIEGKNGKLIPNVDVPSGRVSFST
jgi:hypothetical protein